LTVPDNNPPPRYVPEQQPNRGTRALMHAVEQLAKERGPAGVRVAYKTIRSFASSCPSYRAP
jgi:hypothetical protein